jgi:hypothetical protein
MCPRLGWTEMSRRRLAYLLLSVLPGMVLGQTTHGTINIVLANQNGAIVETDSRLSYKGVPKGEGQKLFQLDDHTVCAIAGFYTAPLPQFLGYSPTPATIPTMVDEYLKERRGQLGDSLAEKMDSLVEIFSFDLNFVTNALPLMGVSDFAPSYITLVGFEKGRVGILQVELLRERRGPYILYSQIQSGQ